MSVGPQVAVHMRCQHLIWVAWNDNGDILKKTEIKPYEKAVGRDGGGGGERSSGICGRSPAAPITRHACGPFEKQGR